MWTVKIESPNHCAERGTSVHKFTKKIGFGTQFLFGDIVFFLNDNFSHIAYFGES